MKKINLIIILFAFATTMYAQEILPVPNSRKPVLVDDVRSDVKQGLLAYDMLFKSLTPEQQSKIKEYKIEKKKQLLQLKNQLGEKQARLNTLETADKADMKAINATIDDIAKLQADMMKAEASYKQKVRTLFDDEQRLAFDSRQQEKKF